MSNGEGVPTLAALITGVVLIGIWVSESSIQYSWIIGVVGIVLILAGILGLLTGRHTL